MRAPYFPVASLFSLVLGTVYYVKYIVPLVLIVLSLGTPIDSAAQPAPTVSASILQFDANALLDGRWGRANIDAFAAAILASANKDCAARIGLTAVTAKTKARDVLAAYIPAVLQTETQLSATIFEARIEKQLGAGAVAEWNTMLKDPKVQKRVEIHKMRIGTWLISDAIHFISAKRIAEKLSLAQFNYIDTGAPDLQNLFDQLDDEITLLLAANAKSDPPRSIARVDEVFEEFRNYKLDPKSSSNWPGIARSAALAALAPQLAQVCIEPKK